MLSVALCSLTCVNILSTGLVFLTFFHSAWNSNLCPWQIFSTFFTVLMVTFLAAPKNVWLKRLTNWNLFSVQLGNTSWSVTLLNSHGVPFFLFGPDTAERGIPSFSPWPAYCVGWMLKIKLWILVWRIKCFGCISTQFESSTHFTLAIYALLLSSSTSWVAFKLA